MSKQKENGIKWTDVTYNPIRVVDTEGKYKGFYCEKISLGCDNCYAEAFNYRYHGTSYTRKLPSKQKLELSEKVLAKITKERQYTYAFISSQTDIFGDWVPSEWIQRIFDAIALNGKTQFQVLTKRPHRMFKEVCKRQSPLPMNIWLGTTTENQQAFDQRIDSLLSIKEVCDRIIWVSVEPMLSTIQIHPLLDWVVCGGESGSKSKRREMKKEWVLDLKGQCAKLKIPFFFKQWNCSNQGSADNLIDGAKYLEFPCHTKI